MWVAASKIEMHEQFRTVDEMQTFGPTVKIPTSHIGVLGSQFQLWLVIAAYC